MSDCINAGGSIVMDVTIVGVTSDGNNISVQELTSLVGNIRGNGNSGDVVGPGTSVAPNNGFTLKQKACAADAVLNTTASFIPTVGLVIGAGQFFGVNVNPVGFITGTNSLISTGNETTGASITTATAFNAAYRDAAYASGASATSLARMRDLVGRVGFDSSSRGGVRLLAAEGRLSALAGAAKFAGRLNIAANVFSGLNDVRNCLGHP